MPATIQIYDPVAPCLTKTQHPAAALQGLSGKVIGFIDNAKPNFQYLVDDLAAILKEKHGIAGVVKRRKRSASQGAPDAVVNELVEQCDAVITGSGD
jgi:hypothetical protein